MSINKSSKNDIKYAEQIIDKNTSGDEKKKIQGDSDHTGSGSASQEKCLLTKPDSRGCQICESLIRKVALRQRGSVRERMSSAR